MSSQDQTDPVHLGSGLGGTLRLLASLVIVLLAALGVLAVFDVIEFSTMGAWVMKIVMLTAIAIVGASAVWALTRTGHR